MAVSKARRLTRAVCLFDVPVHVGAQGCRVLSMGAIWMLLPVVDYCSWLPATKRVARWLCTDQLVSIRKKASGCLLLRPRVSTGRYLS